MEVARRKPARHNFRGFHGLAANRDVHQQSTNVNEHSIYVISGLLIAYSTSLQPHLPVALLDDRRPERPEVNGDLRKTVSRRSLVPSELEPQIFEEHNFRGFHGLAANRENYARRNTLYFNIPRRRKCFHELAKNSLLTKMLPHPQYGICSLVPRLSPAYV